MTGVDGDFDDTPWFNVDSRLPAAIPSADPKRLPPDRLRLGGRGHRFWNEVTRLHEDGKPVYVLRPDEMFLLAEACLHIDRLEQMDANIDRAAGDKGDLYMNGTGGATVANPLLSQRRALSTTVVAMLKQLELPDAVAGAKGATTQREHQSKAAKARWGKTG